MSSILMKLKSPWLVLVMMNIMSVPICNSFHTIRANSGKITFLEGVPLFDASFEENSCTQGLEILPRKTRVLGQPTVKIL